MTRSRFTVPGVDLDLVARSHGWYDLPPFAWDAGRRQLSFVFLHGGVPVPVRLSARGGDVSVTAPVPAPVARRAVERVLDLSTRLAPFHALCAARRAEGFGWMADRGAGRILRSPTLFEDAVKVLCTTNCSWALTKAMASRMVAAF
ncbi:MAG: Fe-S cluster assembly protein HesB, partial [Thermoanaerobaculia bacterium]|nr:Fe-S cluster assembly protein HesB [Thermoanaerobaculia bacterium]